MKKQFLDYIENLQDQITQNLSQIDGGATVSYTHLRAHET